MTTEISVMYGSEKVNENIAKQNTLPILFDSEGCKEEGEENIN